MGITGDNDPSTTLRQMRILGRAITEAAEDCLLARDMEQAVALMKIWDVNAKAIAKLRRDTGQKPKLRKSSFNEARPEGRE